LTDFKGIDKLIHVLEPFRNFVTYFLTHDCTSRKWSTVASKYRKLWM